MQFSDTGDAVTVGYCCLAGLEVNSTVYSDIYTHCSTRYYFSTLILATIFMFIIEENYTFSITFPNGFKIIF